MKTALILGISGGFGRHMTDALLADGWRIKTLVRDPTIAPVGCLPENVTHGDVSQLNDVRAAARGAQVIVYGVNPRKYRWDGVALPLLENAAQVAEELKTTFVFPGNVYNFDPTQGNEILEDEPGRAISSKGVIRDAMEKRLRRAAVNGVRVINLRLGDFIGRDLASAWLGQLIKQSRKKVSLTCPGQPALAHTWAYLPDVAATATKILARRDLLSGYNEFNFSGHELSFAELACSIEQASASRVVMRPFPWRVLKILAPFSPLFRSMLEMRYLWDCEIRLPDQKLREFLGGNIPHTPITAALVDAGLVIPTSAALARSVSDRTSSALDGI